MHKWICSRRQHADVLIPTHTLRDSVPPPLSLHRFAISSTYDRLNVYHPVIIRILQTFTQMQAPPNMLRNVCLRVGDQHRP